MCFAVWTINAAMAPYISEHFKLSPAETGLMLAVPTFAGSALRIPLGILAQYVGRKFTAQINMGIVAIGLFLSFFLTNTLTGVAAMGVLLGVAGASFGVALSLGSGWYPPKYKGLAMGIAGAGNSGAVIASLFAPALAKAFGWQLVYEFAILPMLVAMVLMHIFAKEPPDREERHRFADYLKILVSRDAWVFNLMYMLTFGGYIGLTSFLPTLFYSQYSIPKESVGQYAAGIIVMASILRIAGGGVADKVGGLRMLLGLSAITILLTLAASTLPASPLVMVIILALCFSAMGAGNGAVFQLVPLRFKNTTAVASSLVGEFGGLAGAFLPYAMGIGKEATGTFAPGFLAGSVLALAVLVALLVVTGQWTANWVGAGGKALQVDEPRPVAIEQTGMAA
ncbi:MAG: NarK/NasA family nitrate transporter [Chloroflexi bacterium]|nr:NarK/NasA family nitrate transporter [Chloroflexota bacterium]